MTNQAKAIFSVTIRVTYHLCHLVNVSNCKQKLNRGHGKKTKGQHSVPNLRKQKKMTINLCDTATPSVNQFFRYYPAWAKRWKLPKKSKLIARFTEEHKKKTV